MDVVGEGDDDLVVAVVPLHGDLRYAVVLFAGNIDDVFMQWLLVAVDVAHKLPDAALVAHGIPYGFLAPAVFGGDAQARVQKRLLPHAGVKYVVIVDRVLEHYVVGLEAYAGAGFFGLAHDLHSFGYIAAGEFHLIDFPVFEYLYLQPLGQGVYHGRAHAV